MNAEGVGFVAPLAASRVPAGLFAALPAGAGTAVDYAPARDASKPAAARGSYRVLEDGGMDLHGPRKADPPVHLRRILVYSSANAAGAASARARKLATAAGDLDRLVRTAGTRFHPTADAVAARAAAIAAKRRVTAYLRTAITCDATGRPVLSWHFGQAAIDAEAAADGWYALTANLDRDQSDPADVLRRYKGQHVVERRYGEFKGPACAFVPLFENLGLVQSYGRVSRCLGNRRRYSRRPWRRPDAARCPARPGGNVLPWLVSAQVGAGLVGAGAGWNRVMAGAAAPFAVEGVAAQPRPGRQLPAGAPLLQ
jgi:hypothetical protein